MIVSKVLLLIKGVDLQERLPVICTSDFALYFLKVYLHTVNFIYNGEKKSQKANRQRYTHANRQR